MQEQMFAPQVFNIGRIFEMFYLHHHRVAQELKTLQDSHLDRFLNVNKDAYRKYQQKFRGSQSALRAEGLARRSLLRLW